MGCGGPDGCPESLALAQGGLAEGGGGLTGRRMPGALEGLAGVRLLGLQNLSKSTTTKVTTLTTKLAVTHGTHFG